MRVPGRSNPNPPSYRAFLDVNVQRSEGHGVGHEKAAAGEVFRLPSSPGKFLTKSHGLGG